MNFAFGEVLYEAVKCLSVVVQLVGELVSGATALFWRIEHTYNNTCGSTYKERSDIVCKVVHNIWG